MTAAARHPLPYVTLGAAVETDWSDGSTEGGAVSLTLE